MSQQSQTNQCKSEMQHHQDGQMNVGDSLYREEYSLGDVIYAENVETSLPYLIGTILEISDSLENKTVHLRLYARWTNLPSKSQEQIIAKRRKLVNLQTDGETVEKIRTQFEFSRELFYSYLEVQVPFSKLRGHCRVLNPLPSTFHLFKDGLSNDEFCCCYIYDYSGKSFTYLQGSINIGPLHQAELSVPHSTNQSEFNRYNLESEIIFSSYGCENNDATIPWRELRDELISFLCKSKDSIKGRKTKRLTQKAFSMDDEKFCESQQSPLSKTKNVSDSGQENVNEKSSDHSQTTHSVNDQISKAVDMNQEYFLTELYKRNFDVNQTMKFIRNECKNSETLKTLINAPAALSISLRKIPSDIFSPRSKINDVCTSGGVSTSSNGSNKKENSEIDSEFGPVHSIKFTLEDFNQIASMNKRYELNQKDGICCNNQNVITNSEVESKCYVFKLFCDINGSSKSKGSSSKQNSLDNIITEGNDRDSLKFLCSYCFNEYLRYSYFPSPHFCLSHRYILFEAMTGCFSFLKTLQNDSSFATQAWFPNDSKICETWSKNQESFTGKNDEKNRIYDGNCNSDESGREDDEVRQQRPGRGRSRKGRLARQSSLTEDIGGGGTEETRDGPNVSRRLYYTRSFESKSSITVSAKRSEKDLKFHHNQNDGSDAEKCETTPDSSDNDQPGTKRLRSSTTLGREKDGLGGVCNNVSNNNNNNLSKSGPSSSIFAQNSNSISSSHGHHDSGTIEAKAVESMQFGKSRGFHVMNKKLHQNHSPGPDDYSAYHRHHYQHFPYQNNYVGQHVQGPMGSDEHEIPIQHPGGSRNAGVPPPPPYPGSYSRGMSSNSPYNAQMHPYQRPLGPPPLNGPTSRYPPTSSASCSDYYNSEFENLDAEFHPNNVYTPNMNPENRYQSSIHKRKYHDPNFIQRSNHPYMRKDVSGYNYGIPFDSKHNRPPPNSGCPAPPLSYSQPIPGHSIRSSGTLTPFSYDVFPDCDLCNEFRYLYQCLNSIVSSSTVKR